MSVRVRYRLTNYHCPSSLHLSLPLSLSSSLLQLRHLPCALLSSSTLRPCALPSSFLSPAVASTSAVVTGGEERTNREDLSQNPKKHQKENRNSDLSSLLVCVGVCMFLLDVSEISSDCALGDLSLKTGSALTANKRPERTWHTALRRTGKGREDEKVTGRIIAFDRWQNNFQQLHVPSSCRLAGNLSCVSYSFLSVCSSL